MRAPLLSRREQDKLTPAIMALLQTQEITYTMALPIQLQLADGVAVEDIGFPEGSDISRVEDAVIISRKLGGCATKQPATIVVVKDAMLGQIHKWAKNDNVLSI